MKTGRRIREATREDLDGLELLESRAHHAPWPREAFEDELANRQARIWVIDGEDRLAAMVVYWRVLDELDILDVAVDPLYEGQGLGTYLLRTLILVGTGKGIRRVVLEVRVSNERAIGLYEKLGFKKVGRRPDYYEDNQEDAFVMALDLQGESEKAGVKREKGGDKKG